MNARYEILKCEVCGNVCEVVEAHAGALVCCGAPMKIMTAGAVDAATEKHVPVISETADGYLVNVGSVSHPMLDEHYIEFIELIADGKRYKAYLNPGDRPEALFKVEKAKSVSAREYCNLHGLWIKE